ncbi:MAG TPA: hypothetical protein VH518_09940 [Tepidisphaeraceae bacterium]|jgi:hypothetical protein
MNESNDDRLKWFEERVKHMPDEELQAFVLALRHSGQDRVTELQFLANTLIERATEKAMKIPAS